MGELEIAYVGSPQATEFRIVMVRADYFQGRRLANCDCSPLLCLPNYTLNARNRKYVYGTNTAANLLRVDCRCVG